MLKWTVEGFQGCLPTGFSRQLIGSEKQVRLLLERLAACHLSDDEITDATFGDRKDLDVYRDKRLGEAMSLRPWVQTIIT